MGIQGKVTYPFSKHERRMQVKQTETSLHVIIEFGDKGSGVGNLLLCDISDISFPS